MATPSITTVLFDIGGVLLTNGWDHVERRETASRFGLDAVALERRHAERFEALETGALGFDTYLQQAVFDQPRAFTAAALREYIFSLSQPLDGSLELAAELAANGLELAALNNEGRELNEYRIQHFGLTRSFRAFCSSCYLGMRKPAPEIFQRALGILQRAPGECLFVDDREENLATPRALGIASLRFEDSAGLRAELLGRGLL